MGSLIETDCDLLQYNLRQSQQLSNRRKASTQTSDMDLSRALIRPSIPSSLLVAAVSSKV
jgi:hypothetical protein